jgi:hypothetical protein
VDAAVTLLTPGQRVGLQLGCGGTGGTGGKSRCSRCGCRAAEPAVVHQQILSFVPPS